MRTSHVLVAVVALSGSLDGPAVGGDCRFATTVDRRLVVTGEDGKPVATLGGGERGKWAAAWSPDGRYILYSLHPRMYGDPVDVHLAKADGTEVDVLRVTAAEPRDWDIESIIEIHWLDDERFWHFGRVGFRGRYVDIWRIAPKFALSELESRLAVLGGPCTFSPDLRVVACVTDDLVASTIALFDYRKAVSGDPPPQADPPEDYDAYVFADKYRKADRDARVEGGLHWGSGGRKLVFAVRRAGRLEMGTLERRGKGTKGWKLELREIVGVDGDVKTIRLGKAGYELVTDAGIFRIGGETRETPTLHPTGRALAAVKLGPPEAVYPPGLTEFSVLDRWCPDRR